MEVIDLMDQDDATVLQQTAKWLKRINADERMVRAVERAARRLLPDKAAGHQSQGSGA